MDRKKTAKKTIAEFVEDARKLHGERYDYSEVVYAGNKRNVRIICKEHGVFEQVARSHLKGAGCPECAMERRLEKSAKKEAVSFLVRSKEVHGDIYDYSNVTYTNNKASVEIICKKHGVFEQRAADHLKGSGCPECGRESTNMSQVARMQKAADEFGRRATAVHGGVYDYSMVVYAGCNKKVKILCRDHGFFEQRPGSHLRGDGCPHCGVDSRVNLKLSKSASDFELRAREVHGDLYDYSNVAYVNSRTGVIISCKHHGVFNQTPGAHLRGQGCPFCGGEARAGFWSLVASAAGREFESKAKEVHGELYDYSEVIYTNSKSSVRIVCKKHGVFEQIPNNHLNGVGCPRCSASRMERSAALALSSLNIGFRANATMFNRKRFDIIIPSMSQLWELDGEQHFKPVEAWGGEEELVSITNRDAEKTCWAIDNGWALIRVPYWDEENIEAYIGEYTATPPPPGLIITSHSNGEHSYDKMLEVAGVTAQPTSHTRQVESQK